LVPWTIRGIGLALGVLIVYGLVQLGLAAGNVLLLLFVAILLASALEPIVGTLRDRLPLGRGATILVVYATFLVGMVGMAFIVVPAAIDQGGKILQSLPAFFEQARGWASNARPEALTRSLTALIDSVAGILEPPAAPDPDTVVEVRSAVAEAAVSVRDAAGDRLLLAGRAREDPALRVGLPSGGSAGRGPRRMERDRDSIGSVGSRPTHPAGIYLIIQIVEGNVLLPMVLRNTIGISPLLILVSLLIGGAAGGLVGAFLAVPIAASVEIALSRLQDRQHPVAQDRARSSHPTRMRPMPMNGVCLTPPRRRA